MFNSTDIIQSINKTILNMLPESYKIDFQKEFEIGENDYSYWAEQISSICSVSLKRKIQNEMMLVVSKLDEAKENLTTTETCNLFSKLSERVKIHLFILKMLVKIANLPTHEERMKEIDCLDEVIKKTHKLVERHNTSEKDNSIRSILSEDQLCSFRELVPRVRKASEIVSLLETIPTYTKTIIHYHDQLFDIGLTVLTQMLTLERIQTVSPALFLPVFERSQDNESIRKKHNVFKLIDCDLKNIFLFLCGNTEDFLNNLPVNRFVVEFLRDNIINTPDLNYTNTWILDLITRNSENDSKFAQLISVFNDSIFHKQVSQSQQYNFFKGTCFDSLSRDYKTRVIKEVFPKFFDLIINLMNLRASAIQYICIAEVIAYVGEASLVNIEDNKFQLIELNEIVKKINEEFYKLIDGIKNIFETRYVEYFPESSILTSFISLFTNIYTSEEAVNITRQLYGRKTDINDVLVNLERSFNAINVHIKDISSGAYVNRLHNKYAQLGNISFIFQNYPIEVSHDNLDDRLHKTLSFLSIRNNIVNDLFINDYNDNSYKINFINKNFSYEQISIALKVQDILSKDIRNPNEEDLVFTKKVDFKDSLHEKIYSRILLPYKGIAKNNLIAFCNGYAYAKRENFVSYYARLVAALKIIEKELYPLEKSNRINYRFQLLLINRCLLGTLSLMVTTLPGLNESLEILNDEIKLGKQAIPKPLVREDSEECWQVVSLESLLILQNETLQESLDRANEETSIATEASKKSEQELELSKQINIAQESKIEELKAALIAKEEERQQCVEASDIRIEEYKQRLDEANREKMDYKQRLDEANRGNIENIQRLDEANREKMDYRQRLDEANRETMEFKQRLDEANREKMDYRQRLDEANRETMEFKQRLDEANRETMEYKQRLDELEKIIAEYEHNTKQVKNENLDSDESFGNIKSQFFVTDANTSNQQMNLSVREYNMGLLSNSWFNAGRTSIESEEYMILKKSG